MTAKFERLRARQTLLASAIAVISVSSIVAAQPSGSAATASVVVTVAGVRSSQGMLLVQLFAQADGFPDDPEKAARRLRVPAAAGAQAITFDGLAPGIYAVAVCHDENGNGICDKNIFGIPKEGVGVSNAALRRFGAPRFEDASFTVGAGPVRQTIHLRY